MSNAAGKREVPAARAPLHDGKRSSAAARPAAILRAGAGRGAIGELRSGCGAAAFVGLVRAVPFQSVI